MKIALASDLHLEFAKITLNNEENADVLVLAGDIIVANDLSDLKEDEYFMTMRCARFHEFFQNVSKEFKDIIMIMGNHCHYGGDITKSLNILRQNLAYLPNLHIMDKESITIGDVTFFAGTMWTDMNGEDHNTMMGIKRLMNDFRIIKNIDRSFSSRDAVDDHKEFLKNLTTVLQDDTIEKVVVVSHHAPSYSSIAPQYKNDQLMNGGYASNLDNFICDNPKIKHWYHGHTHTNFDYMIGSTRIVCNPRGYFGYESCADNFKLQYLDV